MAGDTAGDFEGLALLEMQQASDCAHAPSIEDILRRAEEPSAAEQLPDLMGTDGDLMLTSHPELWMEGRGGGGGGVEVLAAAATAAAAGRGGACAGEMAARFDQLLVVGSRRRTAAAAPAASAGATAVSHDAEVADAAASVDCISGPAALLQLQPSAAAVPGTNGGGMWDSRHNPAAAASATEAAFCFPRHQQPSQTARPPAQQQHPASMPQQLLPEATSAAGWPAGGWAAASAEGNADFIDSCWGSEGVPPPLLPAGSASSRPQLAAPGCPISLSPSPSSLPASAAGGGGSGRGLLPPRVDCAIGAPAAAATAPAAMAPGGGGAGAGGPLPSSSHKPPPRCTASSANAVSGAAAAAAAPAAAAVAGSLLASLKPSAERAKGEPTGVGASGTFELGPGGELPPEYGLLQKWRPL
ncbi:hypothetical protein HXX76_015386 [Chlamydomonas incerta]|uniref:Uncharacterized protein n=1 Tax=Chlamydomonas incerta TaxID=51695 RepID=A0A835S9T6_CHLIN|nr:hypothetical protein HXX76_015386 [Chlamydomonas incerta]|eukprot:KAG2423338.1 hypothetical protein HXX76_015386 [Chlamydomonas incerta]